MVTPLLSLMTYVLATATCISGIVHVTARVAPPHHPSSPSSSNTQSIKWNNTQELIYRYHFNISQPSHKVVGLTIVFNTETTVSLMHGFTQEVGQMICSNWGTSLVHRNTAHKQCRGECRPIFGSSCNNSTQRSTIYRMLERFHLFNYVYGRFNKQKSKIKLRTFQTPEI